MNRPQPATLTSDKDVLHRCWVLRKVLSALSPVEAMELMLEKLGRTKTNAEFLDMMASGD